MQIKGINEQGYICYRPNNFNESHIRESILLPYTNALKQYGIGDIIEGNIIRQKTARHHDPASDWRYYIMNNIILTQKNKDFLKEILAAAGAKYIKIKNRTPGIVCELSALPESINPEKISEIEYLTGEKIHII
ncbi:MAG: hypothetical protein ACYCUT_01150 [bacterium]